MLADALVDSVHDTRTHRYENTMSEWLAVEAIVKQKDKENQASAIAKLSSDSISAEQAPNPMQRDLSNDVRCRL